MRIQNLSPVVLGSLFTFLIGVILRAVQFRDFFFARYPEWWMRFVYGAVQFSCGFLLALWIVRRQVAARGKGSLHQEKHRQGGNQTTKG